MAFVSSEWASPSSAGGLVLLLDQIGAGLRNRGNTCFLNAVLQCLVHTVPLVQSVRSFLDHSTTLCSSSGSDERFCSLCALQDLMDRCQRDLSKIVSPDLFVENLGQLSPLFKRYRQEDAHEFLHCLLDSLDGCFKKHDPVRSSLPQLGVVQQIFGGCLCSVVKCCDCGHCSETFDPMLDLSLEIDDVDSLCEALSSFTKVEKVEDLDTKFTCQGCKSQVSVEKQLKLDQVPPVVVLHLKRFKNDGGYFDKIDRHVGCPMELDLKPFISLQDNVEFKYDLYALVVHSGWTSHSGHYYCFIRSSPEVWHKMDDCVVSQVSADEVSEEQAYILFYIKHGSSPWFSTLMQHQKFDAFQNFETETSPSSVLVCTESFNCTSCNPENCGDDSLEKLAWRELDMHVNDGSLDSPANKPEVDNSSFDEVGEPFTSMIRVDDNAEAVHPQVTATSPFGSSMKELTLDVFSDEFLEDEKENHILPSAAQVAKPLKRFKPCSQMQETINRQLRQMDGSRRQALLACMPPSLQTTNPEHRSRKRRLHSESLGENKNVRLPTLKTR